MTYEEKRNTLDKEECDAIAELTKQYAFETWLEDAAVRSVQLNIGTHAAKFVHPDVSKKEGCTISLTAVLI